MNTSWLTYLNLEKELIDCFNYVYFNDSNDQQNVYSNKFTDILLRASIEIETLMKELYRQNGGTKPTKQIKFDKECIAYLDSIFNLSKKVVFITYPYFDFKSENSKLIYPLDHFSMTDSNEWNKSYQHIKHDRLKYYKKGNLRVALHSLAALFLLNVYYKNEKFTIKQNKIRDFDNRFGSSIFSLNKPSDKTKLYSNPYISDESVYEYRLVKGCWEEYEKEYSKYMNKFLSFVKFVPEIKEPAFKAVFDEMVRRTNGISFVFDFCHALSKYRIDKIFNGLTKEEKIGLLHSKTNQYIDENNYDENYMTLIFKEQEQYVRNFHPSFLFKVLNDSFVELSISQIDNTAKQNS